MSQISWVKRLGCISALCLMLSSCGFHLRGMIDMPRWLKDIGISIEQANRDLGPILATQLRAYHVNVHQELNTASYWLIIEKDNTEEQVASISSSTIARQYQLVYTVWFKLQNARGLEVIPTTPVVITRQLTVNSNRILGSNNEEDLLKHEMQREAALQIISRISRANPPSVAKHAY